MKRIIVILNIFILTALFAADRKGVTLLNTGHGKMIHSGFLVGSVSGKDVQKAEIKIDDGSYEEIADPAFWKHKLPSGKETWANGERHTVEIRVTYKNQSSKIKKFSIIKGNNRDLNGDGFPDLVMGDHLYDRSRGAAYVYHGEMQGIQTTGKPAEVIPGSGSEAYFGKTLVIEDVNRDGFADIIISSFDKKHNVKAYIYKGSDTVLGKPYINTVLNDQDKAGYFGITFAIENIPQPGKVDLLIKSKKKKEVKTLKIK